MGKAERRRPHRGRRRKKKKSNFIYNIILIAAIAVFCVSAFQLARIAKGYLSGRSEYKEVQDLAVKGDKPEGGFRVDFEKLLEINPDTVAWIRFYPEPEIISYPVVQGEDNEKYLHQTFSDNENTMGAIFLDAHASRTFADQNTIIYGHRMKDGSMFRHLQDYEDSEFWKENPYFYIYTPDGYELTYHIYSAGVVNAVSDTYRTEFDTEEDYQEFLDYTDGVSYYETGVELDTDDTIVTLSTCTSNSDDNRFVVRGVLEKKAELK